MSCKFLTARYLHLLRHSLGLLLLLALLAAFLPQTAQAATECRTYYVVEEGDTTPYIAHTYGLRWKVIAAANDMNPAEKLTVGQRLCIPRTEEDKQSTKPKGDSNATIQVSISANRIFLNLAKFSQRHVYLVKARDVDLGIGGWEKIELIQVPRNQNLRFVFVVPDELRDIPILRVCLKDVTTDELLCRVAVNP